MTVLWPMLAVLVTCALYFLFSHLRDRAIQMRPFPAEWEPALKQGLPMFDALHEDQQARLKELVKRFIARKTFYGCAGLTVTDEMRVVIAAQACLLLLNHRGRLYPKLRSVLIYPSAFRVQHQTHQADGTVDTAGRDLAGESWSNGKVILSWDNVEHGISHFTDGNNVVLHEFAHQLDSESGSTNGAPTLRKNSYRTWSNVFSSNFDNLRRRAQRRRSTVMDTYGATNPAEFFAVATETFFEKPNELRARRPELYAELTRYYQMDPRDWEQT